MNTQINVRMSEDLLNKAIKKSKSIGFSSIQDFIRELIREKIYDDVSLTKKEFDLVKKLTYVIEKNNLYGTEEDLFKKLK